MTADRTSEPLPGREWHPSELARRDEIGRFGHERDDAHADTLQQAFAADPLFDWVYGDRTGEQQQTFWQLVLQGSSPGTEVHAVQTSGAVAIWLPPVGSVPESPVQSEPEAPVEPDATDVTDESGGPSIRERMAEVLGDRAVEIFELFGVIHASRPEEPHWYLQALGTRPAVQGKGWGTRVLAPMIDRCDRLGLLTYLESSNPQNHAFYHRLGFVDAGEVPASGAPSLMCMRREPRS